MGSSNPIGIFDSGIGGLTVYKALREALPQEDFIYLGDTARLPYGTKSRRAIERCTIGAAQKLQEKNIKFLVIACNTVSAQGLAVLQREIPELSCCGVISAGAEAAAKMTKTGRIAVLATEGTVRAGIYPDVIRHLRKGAEVEMLACSLLVTLVEEGWNEGKEAEAIVARYLSMLRSDYDTLVLACTHFPMLVSVFQKLAKPSLHIVDGAKVTAMTVAELLAARNLLNESGKAGKDLFLVTDMPDRFASVAKHFLGRDMASLVEETDFAPLP